MVTSIRPAGVWTCMLMPLVILSGTMTAMVCIGGAAASATADGVAVATACGERLDGDGIPDMHGGIARGEGRSAAPRGRPVGLASSLFPSASPLYIGRFSTRAVPQQTAPGDRRRRRPRSHPYMAAAFMGLATATVATSRWAWARESWVVSCSARPWTAASTDGGFHDGGFDGGGFGYD